MIVASIQCHDGWWDVNKVKQFTEFMMNDFQVDTMPIYMTGLSIGGFGTWDQLTIFGKRSYHCSGSDQRGWRHHPGQN